MDVQNLHSGIALILIGLFKKVFVADNCALLANYAFAPDTKLNAYWQFLCDGFAFQVYGDFSGYTDIARGSARLLGFSLAPTSGSRISQAIHLIFGGDGISLFRRGQDYVIFHWRNHGHPADIAESVHYYAVSGSLARCSWTFVLWGAYHGTLLILFHIMLFGKEWPTLITSMSGSGFLA